VILAGRFRAAAPWEKTGLPLLTVDSKDAKHTIITRSRILNGLFNPEGCGVVRDSHLWLPVGSENGIAQGTHGIKMVYPGCRR